MYGVNVGRSSAIAKFPIVGFYFSAGGFIGKCTGKPIAGRISRIQRCLQRTAIANLYMQFFTGSGYQRTITNFIDANRYHIFTRAACGWSNATDDTRFRINIYIYT